MDNVLGVEQVPAQANDLATCDGYGRHDFSLPLIVLNLPAQPHPEDHLWLATALPTASPDAAAAHPPTAKPPHNDADLLRAGHVSKFRRLLAISTAAGDAPQLPPRKTKPS